MGIRAWKPDHGATRHKGSSGGNNTGGGGGKGGLEWPGTPVKAAAGRQAPTALAFGAQGRHSATRRSASQLDSSANSAALVTSPALHSGCWSLPLPGSGPSPAPHGGVGVAAPRVQRGGYQESNTGCTIPRRTHPHSPYHPRKPALKHKTCLPGIFFVVANKSRRLLGGVCSFLAASGWLQLPGGGGGGIPCGGKYESTNSGATKPVPLLKNERTNYVWFPIIAHEKQWALAAHRIKPDLGFGGLIGPADLSARRTFGRPIRRADRSAEPKSG